MMNPEWKAKWVEALRSDKYRQVQGRLRDVNGNGFCCLGVLCDIVDPTQWEIRGYLKAEKYFHGIDDYGKKWDMLPNSVAVAVGLEGGDPVLGGGRATYWNDDKDYSFDQIADIIEADTTL
jgi:hypothetical protein